MNWTGKLVVSFEEGGGGVKSRILVSVRVFRTKRKNIFKCQSIFRVTRENNKEKLKIRCQTVLLV